MLARPSKKQCLAACCVLKIQVKADWTVVADPNGSFIKNKRVVNAHSA